MKKLLFAALVFIAFNSKAQQVGDSVTEISQGRTYTGKVVSIQGDSSMVSFTTGKTIKVVNSYLLVGTPASKAKADMEALYKSEYLNLEIFVTSANFWGTKTNNELFVDYGQGVIIMKRPDGGNWKSQVDFLNYFYSKGYVLVQAYPVSGSNPGYQYLLKKKD